MKKIFLLLFALILLSVSTSVFAQTKLDPKIYDKNGFRLDQKNAHTYNFATTTRPILYLPDRALVSSSTYKQLLLNASSSFIFRNQKATTTVDLTAYKQGQPAQCTDYSTFGSVDVDLTNDMNTYNPGDVMIIRGVIKNNNKYPITNLTVRARLVKDIPNPEYLRSEIITLEDFNIVENITLGAGKSLAVNYSHVLPLNSPKGNYKILFYVYNDDRFNQSGLSFTNNATASNLGFRVEGDNTQQIYLDQTKITLNNKPYDTSSFASNQDNSKKVDVSILLVNPSNTAEKMTVVYSLYKWDGLLEKNKVDTKTEEVIVPENSKVNLVYTTKKIDAPVYFLNIKADNTNLKNDRSIYSVKTESNIRFTVSGFDYPRINNFGVNTYPIKVGQEAVLFTCFQNGSNQNALNPVNIDTVLFDDQNNVISETQYNGKIGRIIETIAGKFTPKKDLVNFKTITTITDSNGNVIDKIEDNYKCKDIDPKLCPVYKVDYWTWILYALGGIIVLVFFGVIVWMSIKNKINVKGNKRSLGGVVMLMFVLFSISFYAPTFSHKTEAATRTADFSVDLPQGGSWTGYNAPADPWSFSLGGKISKYFNLIKSGVNLDDATTSLLTVGEVINATSLPSQGYWYLYDPSYGGVSPMDGNNYYKSDYQTWEMTFESGWYSHLEYGSFNVGVPLESGTTTLTSNDSNVVSCESNKCTAVGPGSANITVSFSDVQHETSNTINTCDMFHWTFVWYKHFDPWAGQNIGCIPGRFAKTNIAAYNFAYNMFSWITPYGYVSEATYLYTLYQDYFGGHSNGFGVVNVNVITTVCDYYDICESQLSRDQSTIAGYAFSFAPITYAITVPPTAALSISPPTVTGPTAVSLGLSTTYTAVSHLNPVAKKENTSFLASIIFAFKKVFAQADTGPKFVYTFDWNNDGTKVSTSTPVLPGVEVSSSNTWNAKGNFTFRVKATETVSGISSAWKSFAITVSDKPKVQALFYCVSPNLSWNTVPDATSYDFEVKNKTDLTSVHKIITGTTVDISQYLNNTNVSFGIRAIYSGKPMGDQTWVDNITPACPKLGEDGATGTGTSAGLTIESGMSFKANPPWANQTTKKCAYLGQIDPTIVMSDGKTYRGINVIACSIDGVSVSLLPSSTGGKMFKDVQKNVGKHTLSCSVDYNSGTSSTGAIIKSNATAVLESKCTSLANTVEK